MAHVRSLIRELEYVSPLIMFTMFCLVFFATTHALLIARRLMYFHWSSMCCATFLTPESCLQEGPSVCSDVYRGHSGKFVQKIRIIDPAMLMRQVTGSVKLFISEKGRGFITCQVIESRWCTS